MSGIHVIKSPITKSKLKKIAKERFGDLAKAVVDIKKKIMAIGGELHADEEALLLQRGSLQKDLWDINLYPDKSKNKMIEFDSIINIRPSLNNRSRDVEKATIREKIKDIVNGLIL